MASINVDFGKPAEPQRTSLCRLVEHDDAQCSAVVFLSNGGDVELAAVYDPEFHLPFEAPGLEQPMEISLLVPSKFEQAFSCDAGSLNVRAA